MAIIGALPSILTNGTTADATQVMADFNFIVSQVNANAAAAGANSNITSLTGLTTPVSASLGGTGVSIANNNTFFAGPTAAGSTVPGMRTIVAGDISNATPPLTRGEIAGLQLTAVGSTSAAVSVGLAVDNSALVAISLPAFSKLLGSTWAAGSGAGGMGTGVTLSSNTTYHMFAAGIAGSNDMFFDTSITAANAPGSTTGFRRVLSLRTASAAAALLNVTQIDDNFLWAAPVLDINNQAVSDTVAHSVTLTVPAGLNATALVDVLLTSATVTGAVGWISSLLQTDTAAGGGVGNLIVDVAGQGASGRIPTVTNSASQIRYRTNAASCAIWFLTNGYIDNRGRGGLA